MSKEAKLFKNTALIAAGNICTKGIAFLLLPVYTALLSPEEYGTVDLLLTYTALLTLLLTLQLEQAVFRYLVQERGNPEQQDRYLTSALAAVALLQILFLPAGYLVLSGLSYGYTGFFLAITSMNVLTVVVLQLPRGLDDPVTYTMGSTVYGAAQVLLNALFVAGFRWGVAGIFAANICAAAACILLITCRLRLWRHIRLSCFDPSCLRTMLKFALPVIPYTLGWWVIGVSDRIIIDLTIGAAYNGLYAVANKFPTLFHMIGSIFQKAWTESSYENFHEWDRNDYYRRVIHGAVRFYCACNLGMIAMIPFLFPVLINPQYAEAYFYIPVLTTAMMLHAISALYEAIYFAFKQTRKVVSSTVLAAAVNILVNMLLISRIGLYAASLSTLISYGIILAMRHREMKQTIGVRVGAAFAAGQVLMYALVLWSYYAGSPVFRVLAAGITLVYCCISNRQLVQIFLDAARKEKRV